MVKKNNYQSNLDALRMASLCMGSRHSNNSPARLPCLEWQSILDIDGNLKARSDTHIASYNVIPRSSRMSLNIHL